MINTDDVVNRLYNDDPKREQHKLYERNLKRIGKLVKKLSKIGLVEQGSFCLPLLEFHFLMLENVLLKITDYDIDSLEGVDKYIFEAYPKSKCFLEEFNIINDTISRSMNWRIQPVICACAFSRYTQLRLYGQHIWT